MEPDAGLSPATPVNPPDGYPAELERVLTLPDGATLRIRPIVPDDIERIRHAFLVGDPDAIRRRFLTGAPPTGEGHLRYLVDIDYHRRLAIVGMDAHGNSIGVARYEGTEDLASAEIAVIVEPDWQRRGVGLALIKALMPPAIRAGIGRFEAMYAPDNRAVAALLEILEFTDRRMEDGLMVMTLDLQ
ncbi:MAG: GNAT family N-acetyltransferase [Actinomycetota bacterium]|nr:GNAT family N-acetyltransferase [Actinomycetota bacterium]MDK1039183.1 GNAT family N-acetyltransferase [Actinomycetota bacterium]MDK1097289.1 GNAT family N-acetyltransferase [Actinomycetota bacterium]